MYATGLSFFSLLRRVSKSIFGGFMMGKRGPKRHSIETLAATGSSLTARRKRAASEVRAAQTPRMPAELNAAERTLWKSLLPRLAELNKLSPLDGNQLARYCRMRTQYDRAQSVLDKHGEVYETRNVAGEGVFKTRPEFYIAMKLNDSLSKIERAFGMTPADRHSLDIALKHATKAPAKRPGNVISILEEGI